MGVLFADEDLTRTPIPAGFDVLPILDPNRTAGSYLKSQGLPFGMWPMHIACTRTDWCPEVHDC